jgi:hypothetical protein
VLLVLGYWRAHAGTRLARALLFASIPCVMMGAWYVRNWSLSGRTTDFSLYYHPMLWDEVRHIPSVMRAWILPLDMPAKWSAVVVGAALVLLTVSWLWLSRRQTDDKRSFLPECALLVSLAYAAMVVAGDLWLSAGPINERYLTPMFILVVLGAVPVVHGVRVAASNRLLRAGIVTIGLVLSASGVIRSVAWADHVRRTGGQGEYNGPKWRSSHLVQWVRNLHEDVPVYSNGPGALAYVTGRSVAGLPWRRDKYTLVDDPLFDAKMAQIKHDLRRSGGYVVWLARHMVYDPRLAEEREVAALLGLRPVLSFEDGTVYGL